MTGYAKLYGAFLAERISSELSGQYDLITWVPLSGERLKSRGYDQAMLLAMATALELDDVAVETLVKHTDVPAQSGVGDIDKCRANISGVYAVADPDIVDGKRILLIDDILTTGSTLSECAETLRKAGAKDVVCAALAKTRDGGFKKSIDVNNQHDTRTL
jgi:predicted amidophosphoribosyltransferase